MRKFFTLVMITVICSLAWAKVAVIEKNEDFIVLEYSLENYQINDSKDFSHFYGSDLNPIENIGNSSNYFENVNIVVPENGFVSVQSISNEIVTINLDKDLAPVPEIVAAEQPNKTENYIYEKSDSYSSYSRTLKIDRYATFRSTRLASIKVFPLSYNEKNKQINFAKKWRFKVTINGDKSQKNNFSDGMDSYLESVVVNPEAVSKWKIVDNSRGIENDIIENAPAWYRFEIGKDGMYKISGSDLASLPLDDIDPASFRIYSTGGASMPLNPGFDGLGFKEIPLLMNDGDDGSFDSSDSFIFYAHDRNGYDQNEPISSTYSSIPNEEYYNPYSNETYYWLTWDGSSQAKRISKQSFASPIRSRSSFPFTQHYEEEIRSRETASYNWYSSLLLQGSTFIRNFYATNAVTNVGDVVFGLHPDYSGSSKQTVVTLRFNNQILLSNESWTTNAHRDISFNDVSISSSNTAEIMNVVSSRRDLLVDYIIFTYERSLIKTSSQLEFTPFDADENDVIGYSINGSNVENIFLVNDFDEVSSLDFASNGNSITFNSQNNENSKYYVCDSNDYFSISNFGEYSVEKTFTSLLEGNTNSIIITAEELRDQAEQLEAIQEEKLGLVTEVITQQNIFDIVNAGMPDPVAIRLFVKQLYNSQPNHSLEFVTLFGSGTRDWKNNSNSAEEKNKIMIPLGFKYDNGNSTFTSPSDDHYTYFNSGEYIPQVALGRITAQNSTEAQKYIDRVNLYLDEQQLGFWRNKVFALADDEFGGGSEAESYHSNQLNDLINQVDKGVVFDEIFSIEYDMDQFRNKPQIRKQMIDSINEGRLIWYYIGHGSNDKLGDEDYFKGTTDLSSLNNMDNLTLFIAASCSVGEYDNEGFDSLAEKMIVYDNGGAIASMAATRTCSGGANTSLYRRVIKSSVEDYTPAGVSLMLGKAANNSYSNDKKHILFGDPSLPINPPRRLDNMSLSTDSNDVLKRQKIMISGSFNEGTVANAKVFAYEPEFIKEVQIVQNSNIVSFTGFGDKFFNGQTVVETGSYNQEVIIPKDARLGENARILVYGEDLNSNKAYISYKDDINISGDDSSLLSDDIPQIDIWFDDNEEFVDGMTVSEAPVLKARISDNDGVNVLGRNGHSIIALIDGDGTNILDVSEGFIFDANSATEGLLEWQLPGFSKGNHTLQLIAYDNYNNPSWKTVHFSIDKSSQFKISNVLPYPNPMEKEGYFTFELSQDARVSVSIYTITGKKIKTLKSAGVLPKGFNKIAWDGKDADGDYISNNTYFFKVKAKSILTNKSDEVVEKVVVYK